jgi:hypothetical protein
MTRRSLSAVTAALVVALAVTHAAVTAPADPVIEQSKGFRKAVKVEDIRAHQVALQAIGTANGGNRLAGTSGHDLHSRYRHHRPRSRIR